MADARACSRFRRAGPWHQRARHALGHSLRVRLVVVFLLLAVATTVAFIGGMQKAWSVGWRDAARPLVMDYVDRLAAEVGSPPDVARAQAITERLPVAVRISGPQVEWQSGPMPAWRPSREDRDGDAAWGDPLLSRMTADGHRIDFGLSVAAWRNQPNRIGWMTLTVLLVLTAFAYLYVRRLLRPLDDIRDGAGRFGQGDFQQPIPVRRRDELGVLAHDINAMAHDIHQMLEAKRGLLLAISHELRSPLTRARLNTELLPETPDTQASRDALLRDLAEMRDLISGLLESERLATRHASLNLEPTDLTALVREVAQGFGDGQDGQPAIALHLAASLPLLPLDPARLRLLVRNLLDNALRHSMGADRPPELHLSALPGQGIVLRVRDFGAGVDEASLPHLAEPFWRADASRERATGGVGLGLYLCRLVAQAHGAQWQVRNASPGLEIIVSGLGSAVAGAAG